MNLRFWRKKKSLDVNEVMSLVLNGGSSALASNEEAFEKQEYVYDCIRTRAEKVASIPWNIWTYNSKGEPIENVKLETLFKNPNPLTTSTQFIESIVAWLDLRGFAYIHLNLPFIEVLDSDCTHVTWKDGTPTGRPEDVRISYYRGSSVPEVYTLDDVKIIKNFTPYARLSPVSTLTAAFGTVEIQENQDRAIANLMKNGAYIPVVLTSDQGFTDDEVKLIQNIWRDRYSGIDNAGAIPVFGGGLRPEKIGLTPADMMIIDRENLTKDRIYAAFGVPKKDFQNLNRATAEVQQEFFIRTTIMPFADSIAEQITKFVLNNQGEFKFDYGELPEMQGDMLTRAQIEEIHVRSGIRLINEVRDGYGLPPVPWGNDFWNTMNMVSLGQYQETAKMLTDIKKDIESLKHKEKEIIVLKDLSREQRNTLTWKIFITRTQPQEQKLTKELNKMFSKWGEKVVSKLTGEKAIKLDITDFVGMNLVPDEFKNDFIKLVTPYLKSFMQQAGDATVSDYGLGIDFSANNLDLTKWLATKLENSGSEIIRTTRSDLYDTLIEGINNGESIPQLADRVSTLFEETYKNRSATIARTEVISSSNMASLSAASQGGMQTKTWLTAEDERVREWHQEADGQVRNIDEPFDVGGEQLDFPGDPQGSPENIINCRCTLIFGIGDE